MIILSNRQKEREGGGSVQRPPPCLLVQICKTEKLQDGGHKIKPVPNRSYKNCSDTKKQNPSF